jgi:hypothetical protein
VAVQGVVVGEKRLQCESQVRMTGQKFWRVGLAAGVHVRQVSRYHRIK